MLPSTQKWKDVSKRKKSNVESKLNTEKPNKHSRLRKPEKGENVFQDKSALEVKAETFAREKHKDQVRKYGGEPYVNHLAEVAELVRTIPHNDQMMAACWLHDVVEDQHVLFSTLEQEFGYAVMELVENLTDLSKPEDGNRKKRKEIDRMHTANSCRDAKTIKLADLISNSRSILGSDYPEAKAFARVYVPEKKALLEVLTEGNPVLYEIAKRFVED